MPFPRTEVERMLPATIDGQVDRIAGLASSAFVNTEAATSLIAIPGGVRSGASMPSISCSSPLLNICFTMSQPPTNSLSM